MQHTHRLKYLKKFINKACEKMIGKFLNLFKRNNDYSYGIYEDERFILTNHDIL